MDQLQDFSIDSKAHLITLVESYAFKFKFNNNCKKSSFKLHLQNYILLLVGSNSLTETELNHKIWKHIYRWIINNVNSVNFNYTHENGNILTLDQEYQPYLLTDLMMLWKLELIDITDTGMFRYKILNY